MITITIDRKLLEEVVELFDSAITARHPHEILRDIRAALAAPATAPAQPAWHDAPTVPGLWVSDFSWMAQKLGRETVEFYAKNRSIPSRRWYGPIPEDKP